MNQINLVPIEYKKRLKRKWYVFFGILGTVITCVILVTLALIPVFQIRNAEKLQEELKFALAHKDMVETKMILEEIQVAHNTNSQAAKLIASLDTPSHLTRQTMDVIVGSVPKGLRMNEVLMESSEDAKGKNTIVLKGQSQNITKVAQYVVQLYNTGQFEITEYVANPSDNKELFGWVDYDITIIPKNFIIEETKAPEEITSEDSEEFLDDEIEVEPKKDAGGEELL